MIKWDKAKVHEALTICQTCESEVLLEVKRLLNQYNNWHMPSEYYDTILGDWIVSFTHQMYIAWREVVDHTVNITEWDRQVFLTPPDLQGFHQLSTNDDSLQKQLQLKIYSQITKKNLCVWSFEQKPIFISNKRYELFVYKWLRYFVTKQPRIMICEPYFNISRFSKIRAIWRWRKFVSFDNVGYPVSFEASINAKWRAECFEQRSSKTETFVDLVLALLPIYLPVAVVEGLSTYRKAMLQVALKRPQMVYSAQSLHSHLAWKILLAEWRLKGTVLVYHQHGASYGTASLNAIENYEKRAADRYYTFGWTTGEQHVSPLGPPAPKRSRCPYRRRKWLLLICQNMPKSPYRLHFQPMPGGTIEHMHSETLNFLDKLDNKKNLLIRPYFVDYGWNMLSRLKSVAPTAVIDQSETSSLQFSRSRLVVHTAFSTSFLEAMFCNVPSICIYDPSIYLFRGEAEPYIQALELAQIIHRSSDYAVKFVNSLDATSGGINLWWLDVKVQAARLRFVKLYANYSNDWMNQFEREFQRLLADNDLILPGSTV